ncbi:MAG: DinB family protein [Saprospiraceae bacterium]
MKHQIEIMRKTRSSFIYACKDLSIEQLNLIPAGFNNNIIWNFGHIIVTQQGLCYGLSGLPQKVDKDLIAKFRRGSKPEGFVSAEEYSYLQDLSVSLIDEFEADLKTGIFKEYSPFMTSLRVEVDSFEKAVMFNAYHEGLHLGFALAQRKLV